MNGAADPVRDGDRAICFLSGAYRSLTAAETGGGSVRLELDLGCGPGSFAAALAGRFPRSRIIAADVMIGRLRKLAGRCRRDGIGNVAPCRAEARYLVTVAIPDGVVDRIHLLCPDPWPKERHRRHRLLTSDFTAQLHRVLKPDGVFHFSSDDEAYCDAAARLLPESGLFAACGPDADLAGLMSDFERRWRDRGRTVRHLYFRRLPPPPHVLGH